MSSNETILNRFQPGEILIIQPADTDDPEANQLAGQPCVFQRYVPHTGHAVVTCEACGGRVYLRPQDLRRK